MENFFPVGNETLMRTRLPLMRSELFAFENGEMGDDDDPASA